MIDISIAIAAACAGFAAGWICWTAVEQRQSYWLDYCRRRRSLRRPGPYSIRAEGFCIPPETDPRFGVPWEEGTVQRGNGHGGPTTPKAQIRPTPQQPLTADLIRYWKWQDEQVRQALEDGTNNQPPGDAP